MKVTAIPVLLACSSLMFGCSEQEGTTGTQVDKGQETSGYSFSAEKKDATTYTEKANKAVYDLLAFDDKRAFEDVDRGFIAPLKNDGVIEGIPP